MDRERTARALERIGPTEYWDPRTKHPAPGRRMIPAIDSTGSVRSRDWVEQGPAELAAGNIAQTKEGYQRLYKLMGGGGHPESEEAPPFQRPEERYGNLIPEIANYVQPLSGGEHLVGAGRSWAKGDIPEALIETISEAPGLGKGVSMAFKMGPLGERFMPMAMDLIDPAQHMAGDYLGLGHGHDHGGGDHGQGEDHEHEEHEHHEDGDEHDEHKHEEDPDHGRHEIAGGDAGAAPEGLFDRFGKLLPRPGPDDRAPTARGRMMEPLIRKLMGQQQAAGTAGPGAPSGPTPEEPTIHGQDELWTPFLRWLMGKDRPTTPPVEPGPSMPPPPPGHMYADDARPPPAGPTGAPPPGNQQGMSVRPEAYWMNPPARNPWSF